MLRKAKAVLCCTAAVATLAGAHRATQDEEPCCGIVAVAGNAITVATNRHGYTFTVTLAGTRPAAGLAVGTPVSIDHSSKLLVAHARGAAGRGIPMSQIRFAGFAPQGGTGAIGSAASSAGSGEGGVWKRMPKSGGGCPWIIETPTQQCVRTHTGANYCDYYCVPITKRPK